MPWVIGEVVPPGEQHGEDPRRHAPATLRNRDAIMQVLRDELPDTGQILEIASGSGEHIVHFAAAMPHLSWIPSDPDPAAIASIAAHLGDTILANVAAPVMLDAEGDWPVGSAAAVLCINMTHIAPWPATVGLFAGAARVLAPSSPLIIYGPFIESDRATAESNTAFDADLHARNPAWGLRNIAALNALAAIHGFSLTQLIQMPANNFTLIWRRQEIVARTPAPTAW